MKMKILLMKYIKVVRINLIKIMMKTFINTLKIE